jgi:FkbM family methyltransferase
VSLRGSGVRRFEGKYGCMYVPAQDTVIGMSLSLYGEWAEHEIDSTADGLVDGDAIVDVGANVGTHSLAFAARFPRSPIVAIEPQPFVFALLAANAVVNGYSGIEALNVGCDDRTSVAPAGDDAGKPVLFAPLDELALPGRVQLIKIDVEGTEDAVIRGARETIERDRPRIYFAVSDAPALEACHRALTRSDYELYWLETWTYNRNNFNRCDFNVWARCELGVIAYPREANVTSPHPRVPEAQRELPQRLDPAVGYDGPPVFSAAAAAEEPDGAE